MSYYNNVVVVFSDGSHTNGQLNITDFRTAGQMLPSGAIPLAIVNFPIHTYFEVINEHEPSDVLAWIEKEFEAEEELSIRDVIRSDDQDLV